MTVAIPKFKDLIAPRFEVARSIVLARIDSEGRVHREMLNSSQRVGFERIQMLIHEQVDAVICSGIKRIYRDLLQLYGIRVFANVNGTIDSALSAFLRDELHPQEIAWLEPDQGVRIPLDELIRWTRDLFTESGYAVYSATDRAPFPVDLVAEIRCPVCHKPIRVAICCGAHAYRCDQEITQLHQVAGPDFHARVYIHSSTEQVQRCCLDYDIELLDPNQRFTACERPGSRRLPILQNAIPGHERAFARTPER